jgi:hypothetical protein
MRIDANAPVLVLARTAGFAVKLLIHAPELEIPIGTVRFADRQTGAPAVICVSVAVGKDITAERRDVGAIVKTSGCFKPTKRLLTCYNISMPLPIDCCIFVHQCCISATRDRPVSLPHPLVNFVQEPSDLGTRDGTPPYWTKVQ